MNHPTNNIVTNDFVQQLIRVALEEDIKEGDVTTNAIVGIEEKGEAIWKAKQPGVIAGLGVAGTVFRQIDETIQWHPLVSDGDSVEAGQTIVKLQGRCRSLLTAERTALNFAQRLSGIATKTHQFVEILEPYKTQVLDTRKTTPGFRLLDKYAVRCGGGTNHRMGLYDLALIKDNHLTAAGGIIPAVQKVRERAPHVKIEVETKNLEEIERALEAGADIIMLDNMSLSIMQQAVEQIDSRAKTEASGNITIENLTQVAETGVDYISVGALTHSVSAFDISQLFVE